MIDILGVLVIDILGVLVIDILGVTDTLGVLDGDIDGVGVGVGQLAGFPAIASPLPSPVIGTQLLEPVPECLFM